jgi:hypothetical protein
MLTSSDYSSSSLPMTPKDARPTLHLNGGGQDLSQRVSTRYRTPRPAARITSRIGSVARNATQV